MRDAAGEVLGTASREQVHAAGLWHAVFHCQIVAVRSGEPHMVLQRRHRSKLAFGGLLDVSSAGHLEAGEGPDDGVRELHEELGVEASPEELVPLGVRRMIDDQGEGNLNQELTHVYLLRDDRPLNEYRLAAGEIDAVFEASTAELLALFGQQETAVTLEGYSEAGVTLTESFSLTDFVPDLGYWIALTVMSERFGLGLHPVAI